MMSAMTSKSLNAPDETRKFPKGKLELVTLGGITLAAPPSSQAGSGPNR
jgi:hypothetical protein